MILVISQLVHDAIHLAASKIFPSLATAEQFPHVLQGIAAIHIGYHKVESQIHWFTELSKLFPELPSRLIKQPKSTDAVVSILLV